MVDIGKIKELRVLAQKTHREMGAYLNHTDDYYQRRECGDRCFNGNEIARMAGVFGVPVGELYKTEGAKIM